MVLNSIVSPSSISSSDIVSLTDEAISAGIEKSDGVSATFIIILSIVVFLFIMLILELLRSKYALTLTRKFITLDRLPKAFDGTKLAVVSDLHQMRFGEGNSELAKRIKRENPDYIFFVGDMGDSDKFNVDAFYDLLENLGDKIPILMVPGNHDLRLGNGSVHKNFVREVERSGAVILSNTSAEMVSGGKKLYIYGFCQPLKAEKNKPAREWSFANVSNGDVETMLGKCPKDAPVILLAHDPQPFMSYEAWGADLVLAGHLHGGGIRLPYLGGVFGPRGTLFPKYSAGLIEGRKSKMFVTRGLASPKLPRFLNPPEIAVLTLTCPGSPLLDYTEQPMIVMPKYRIDEPEEDERAAAVREESKRRKAAAAAAAASRPSPDTRRGSGSAARAAEAKEPSRKKSSGQFDVVRDWFKSEGRSIRELLYERFNQVSDFFALMFGKKRSKYSVMADENKKRNTYIAPNSKKKKTQHRYASGKNNNPRR